MRSRRVSRSGATSTSGGKTVTVRRIRRRRATRRCWRYARMMHERSRRSRICRIAVAISCGARDLYARLAVLPEAVHVADLWRRAGGAGRGGGEQRRGGASLSPRHRERPQRQRGARGARAARAQARRSGVALHGAQGHPGQPAARCGGSDHGACGSGLGDLALRLGQPLGGADYFELVLAQRPDSVEALTPLADLYGIEGIGSSAPRRSGGSRTCRRYRGSAPRCYSVRPRCIGCISGSTTNRVRGTSSGGHRSHASAHAAKAGGVLLLVLRQQVDARGDRRARVARNAARGRHGDGRDGFALAGRRSRRRRSCTGSSSGS